MAVDFTKVFTTIGKYIKKLNVDYGYIATLTTDQSDLETVLVAQSVTRLVDGLDSMYDGFRSNIAAWVQSIINRTTEILTDPALVTDQYAFGTTPSVATVLVRMIKDMSLNDKNVTASAMTTGSITRTVSNSESGNLVVGTLLDGATPPMSGAPIVPEYAGLTSLLYPDDETITFTCTQDSENGAQRGGERFAITGTGAGSSPYSVDGENLGSAGTINVADTQAATYLTNPSFETWSGSPLSPNGWVAEVGTAGTDFERSTNSLYGSPTYAFKTIQAGNEIAVAQDIPSIKFIRGRSYFITAWAKKFSNTGDDQILGINLQSGTFSAHLAVAPTSATVWQLFSEQFVIPHELESVVEIYIDGDSDILDPANDPVLLDQIVITPCTYVAGAAFALFGGKEKFLQGDTLSIRLQNNNAGVIGTYFRKAHRVQLPVDSTPTISDSLAT